MTEQLNIAELRRMREQSGHDDEGSKFHCAGCRKMHTRCECAEIAFDGYFPALLDAAEERDAAESLAWDALGRPEGTHDTTNVQRLCEAHGAIKAKLAAAEEERDAALGECEEVARAFERREPLGDSIGTAANKMVDALRAAEDRTEALEAARDLMEKKVITCGVVATHPDPLLTATKTCYAETWNSPQADAVRALRAERDAILAHRDAIKERLVALAEAAEEAAFHVGVPQVHAHRLDYEVKLMSALAAAKVQP